MKRNDRVRCADGRDGTVLCGTLSAVRVAWDDGGETYVNPAFLTTIPSTCSLDEALAFVERARAQCAEQGGQSVAVPLRVLDALAKGVR